MINLLLTKLTVKNLIILLLHIWIWNGWNYLWSILNWSLKRLTDKDVQLSMETEWDLHIRRVIILLLQYCAHSIVTKDVILCHRTKKLSISFLGSPFLQHAKKRIVNLFKSTGSKDANEMLVKLTLQKANFLSFLFLVVFKIEVMSISRTKFWFTLMFVLVYVNPECLAPCGLGLNF